MIEKMVFTLIKSIDEVEMDGLSQRIRLRWVEHIHRL